MDNKTNQTIYDAETLYRICFWKYRNETDSPPVILFQSITVNVTNIPKELYVITKNRQMI